MPSSLVARQNAFVVGVVLRIFDLGRRILASLDRFQALLCPFVDALRKGGARGELIRISLALADRHCVKPGFDRGRSLGRQVEGARGTSNLSGGPC